MRSPAAQFIFTCLLLASFLPVSAQIDGELPREAAVEEGTWPDSSSFIFYTREPMPTNLDDIRQRIGYPATAKDAGIDDGKFVVGILVDKKGEYVRHYVVRKAHPSIMESVEPLVPEIRWTPAEKDGKPVAAWVTLPFNICFPK